MNLQQQLYADRAGLLNEFKVVRALSSQTSGPISKNSLLKNVNENSRTLLKVSKRGDFWVILRTDLTGQELDTASVALYKSKKVAIKAAKRLSKKTGEKLNEGSGILARGKAQDDAVIELTRNRSEQKWALQFATWLRKGPSSVPPAPKGIKPERAAFLKIGIQAILSEGMNEGFGRSRLTKDDKKQKAAAKEVVMSQKTIDGLTVEKAKELLKKVYGLNKRQITNLENKRFDDGDPRDVRQ